MSSSFEIPFTRLRNVMGVGVLVAFGQEIGMSGRDCLSGTGLLESVLTDPAAIVAVEQEIQIIRNILAIHGEVDGLGVIAGARYHANAFGPLGIALTSCQSARSALSVAIRFFDLTFALTRFAAEDVDDLTVVTIDASQLPVDVRKFVVERDTTVLSTVQQDLFSLESALESVDFMHGSPADTSQHSRVLGVTPKFGAPCNVARLRRDVLLKRLPQANELAFKRAEQECTELLEQLQRNAGLTAQVRELLAHELAKWSSMVAVAERFCITPRTLRRRLAEEGTTFIAIKDGVRLLMGLNHLENSDISIEEISRLLDYADPTSFITAFKRWKGMTPLAFRKSLQGN